MLHSSIASSDLKMQALLILALGLTAVAAGPAERIVGGSVTNIVYYPYAVAMLSGNNFRHSCGGSILNERKILSAAHCFANRQPHVHRCRVGSTYSNSGGRVYNFNNIIIHPNYHRPTLDSDLAVLHISGRLTFSNTIRSTALAAYDLADNTPVYAIGWGATSWLGATSHNLRHVLIWIVNHNICVQRYSARRGITHNMLCAGWLDVGGRDQCSGDSGGPLLHNHNIVGICSFGHQCAHPHYPGVNVRVSRFINWIVNA